MTDQPDFNTPFDWISPNSLTPADAPMGGSGPGFSVPEQPQKSFVPYDEIIRPMDDFRFGQELMNVPKKDQKRVETEMRTIAKNRFIIEAPIVMKKLMRDLDINALQAAAVVGNLAHESTMFLRFNEDKPKKGPGGYGWAQWTGVRRRKFFNWAIDHAGFVQVSWDSTNYNYFINELESQYADVLKRLRSETDLEEAVEHFEDKYEHAGTPRNEMRVDLAEKAFSAYYMASMSIPPVYLK